MSLTSSRNMRKYLVKPLLKWKALSKNKQISIDHEKGFGLIVTINILIYFSPTNNALKYSTWNGKAMYTNLSGEPGWLNPIIIMIKCRTVQVSKAIRV